jgi:uncharacterized protein YaaQ
MNTEMNNGGRKKLVVAILPLGYVDIVLDALTQAGFRSTRISTSGGFLRRGNATLVIGTGSAQVGAVIKCVREACLERLLTSAADSCITAFVLDIEQSEQF